MKFKQSAGNKKMSGAKTANVVIEKLDDATEAGKKNSKFRGLRILAFFASFCIAKACDKFLHFCSLSNFC